MQVMKNITPTPIFFQVDVRTQSENIEKGGSLHKNTAGDTLLSRKQAIISTFCLNILVTVPNYATHWFSI